MASTSTNKQPLLVDRPLHNVFTLSNQKTGDENYWLSTNNCQLIVDCSQNDGALIEDIYIICKVANDSKKISLFMGGSDTSAVRESDSSTVFLGQFESGVTAGAIVHFGKMPLLLAPNPTSIASDTAPGSQEAGDGTQKTLALYQGLYVPRGRTLWAGLAVPANTGALNLNEAPTLGVSGGYY